MLTIGYIAKHQVNVRFMECLMNALAQIQELKPKLKSVIGKSNIVHARSMIVTDWYVNADENDLFLFIDSDQTFTANDIKQVVNLNGDLRAGLYANRNQKPTSQLISSTTEMYNVDLLYAATGFLCFTKNALQKIHAYMKTSEQIDTVTISDNVPGEQAVIPFFHPVFEKRGLKTYWLGEDFSFSYRARMANLTIKGAYLPTLGHEIPFIVYTKSPVKVWPKKTIAYYCGNSRSTFGPEMQSLGGSEQGVIFLSNEFAKKGYKVTIFGNVNECKTTDAVEYKSFNEFNTDDTFDTVILWRRYGLEVLPRIKNANKIFVDLHDPTSVNYLPKDLINAKVKSIFVKSIYHRNIYNYLDDEKFTVVANGLKPQTVNNSLFRDRNRFCYTSSYDRGLVEILTHLWPKLKKAIPEATFHIYYGNSLLPHTFISILEPLLKQPGVHDYGRSTYEIIDKAHQTCLAKIYTTDTPLEIDCLSVREAAAAGCIPIMSTSSVFSERAGIHIEGFGTEEFWSNALETILKLHSLPEQELIKYQEALKDAALKQTWQETAEKWLQVIDIFTIK